MTAPIADPPARKPRADAERNRKRLLQVAKTVFRRKGAEASLDEIAREAAVGIGTLYRHYPTRTDLVQAVYLDELALIEEAAIRLSDTHEPVDALRQWLFVFIEFMVAKRIVREVLETMVGGPKWPVDAGSRIEAALTRLIDRAVDTGAIELRMQPMDLLRAIMGVATSSPSNEWEEGARRLVEVLVAGLQRPQSGKNTSTVG
ncbi:TetR/AcrR family transcriptional regulator [soil metagenome]